MIAFTNPHYAGLLPKFFSPYDERPAKEQADTAYAHGGGWQSFHGFALHDWETVGAANLRYPGDPPMKELSRATLREETIILFESSWVAIIQPDGAYEVSRMD